jgi:hypothetical protein
MLTPYLTDCPEMKGQGSDSLEASNPPALFEPLCMLLHWLCLFVALS